VAIVSSVGFTEPVGARIGVAEATVDVVRQGEAEYARISEDGITYEYVDVVE